MTRDHDQAESSGAADTRVAALEHQLAELQQRAALDRETDECLERAMQQRLSLAGALDCALPLLGQHLGAVAACVRTFDEDLRLRDFHWAAPSADRVRQLDIDRISAVTDGRHPFAEATAEGSVLGQHLDVAGELFGSVAVRLPNAPAADELRRVAELLTIWCEELDDFLAAIARSRFKQRTTREISAALTEPVLDLGIDRAVTALRQAVPFDDLVVAYRHEEDLLGQSIGYRVYHEGELVHDSTRTERGSDIDRFIRSAAFGDENASRTIAHCLGMKRFQEEVLISGIKHGAIVGRVIISRGDVAFNTFDRDLLGRFADHLRQRVVDFNREWKHLSLCFPPAVVQRLLGEANYIERFLRPREKQVAIMFCDISGFTRLSEQLLREPALIGRLIDVWSARAVDIIWDTGGVFDKMVGDCVIGLWGPPFFEQAPAAACRSAALAARRIRDFTHGLVELDQLPQLRQLERPPGVATGLNYCPLYVGLFGPNEDYTGFSSGMNNTARLQGVACRDEILCLAPFVEAHGDLELFGPPREARVKNVEHPLVFRELLG